MASFLAGLDRAWWSAEPPGVRAPRRPATYSAFDWRALPPMPSSVTADYSWLSSSPVHEGSSLAERSGSAQRDLAEWADHAELSNGSPVPPEFMLLVHDQEMRRHLRSATACYFDLGDHTVEMPGGRLIHFLSDSQWIRHWLLFAGNAGDHAVVTTSFPAGFQLTQENRQVYRGEPVYEVCASTFLEFIWRFWIENEIWFALTHGQPPFTSGQKHYAEHYGTSSRTVS